MVQDQVNQTTLRTFTFVRTAGAESSYAFTLSAGQGAAGVIASYGGVNTVGIDEGQSNPASASITAPAISTGANNSVLVGTFATATSATIAPPAGMLEGAESAFKSGPRKVTIEISDQTIGAMANTGSRAAQASKSAMNVGLTLALNPLP